jgi:hypothetical protein
VLFPSWETFYVIVGSSAGALTGLMFVVIALVAEMRGSARQIDAFGTPTVVHFGAVLLLSVLLAAPWPAIAAIQIALATFGLVAVVYMLIVMRREQRQTEYKPVFEDWLFHAALPLAAYVAVFAAAGWLPRHQTRSLFVIGSAAVLLVFVGLHNAWDTVIFVVVRRWEERSREAPSETKQT